MSGIYTGHSVYKSKYYKSEHSAYNSSTKKNCLFVFVCLVGIVCVILSVFTTITLRNINNATAFCFIEMADFQILQMQDLQRTILIIKS